MNQPLPTIAHIEFRQATPRHYDVCSKANEATRGMFSSCESGVAHLNQNHIVTTGNNFLLKRISRACGHRGMFYTCEATESPSLIKGLVYLLTHKALITTAADDKFCDICPNFR